MVWGVKRFAEPLIWDVLLVEVKVRFPCFLAQKALNRVFFPVFFGCLELNEILSILSRKTEFIRSILARYLPLFFRGCIGP